MYVTWSHQWACFVALATGIVSGPAHSSVWVTQKESEASGGTTGKGRPPLLPCPQLQEGTEGACDEDPAWKGIYEVCGYTDSWWFQPLLPDITSVFPVWPDWCHKKHTVWFFENGYQEILILTSIILMSRIQERGTNGHSLYPRALDWESNINHTQLCPAIWANTFLILRATMLASIQVVLFPGINLSAHFYYVHSHPSCKPPITSSSRVRSCLLQAPTAPAHISVVISTIFLCFVPACVIFFLLPN